MNSARIQKITFFFFFSRKVKLTCTSEAEKNTFLDLHTKARIPSPCEDVTLKTAIIKR